MALITYGYFLGQKGCKLIAGVSSGGIIILNVIIILILTWVAIDNDCGDPKDCPIYGTIPKVLVIFVHLAGLPYPTLYFILMILAQTDNWDPNIILQRAKEQQNDSDVNADNQNSPIELAQRQNRSQKYTVPSLGRQQNNKNEKPPPMMIIQPISKVPPQIMDSAEAMSV